MRVVEGGGGGGGSCGSRSGGGRLPDVAALVRALVHGQRRVEGGERRRELQGQACGKTAVLSAHRRRFLRHHLTHGKRQPR